MGVSGEAMIRALIDGDQSLADMAQLARGRMRRKIPELEQALNGGLDAHHRFILALQLNRIRTVEADLVALEEQISERLAPHDEALSLLLSIPGVDHVTASTIIAEIGTDMSRFPGGAHLASWAGLCPGSYESAGRKHGGRTRRGNAFLKAALVTAAVVASRTRGTYYAEKYRRLCARRGKLRAAVAVAHRILLAAYHMLSNGTPYVDPGAAYLDALDTKRVSGRLVRRLNAMGFEVTLR